MCGIAVIFGDTSDKEEKLKLSLSKISHRGEHQFEHKVFDRVAFGANRLAIVDEALGSQPQQDESGTVFAVQNGEIFNLEKLTKQLEPLGYVFRTHNDTEALVHLWKEYGEKMVHELDSEMFAFAIYDKQSDEIFIARDAIGVKPLYYAFDEAETLYVASEIKALVCLDDLAEIHEFPPGHYFYKGKFVKYCDMFTTTAQQVTQGQVQELIENAVAKRVQTGLPIAVFLSGGVDSSLVMELATRFHDDVTALILGGTDSPDYMHAIKLCREKGWKYKVTEPQIDYERQLADIIYHVETYDPLVVRHSFANDVISKFAHKLGFKVVLTGEGADEIFGGYNEFLEIDTTKINFGCKMLLESMSKGHLMRVDKMAMRYTVETRCPFFDAALVDVAMSTDGPRKVGDYKGKRFTKLCLREAALQYLPEYIAMRDKVPFANGAGMDVGNNYTRSDGVLAEMAGRKVTDKRLAEVQQEFPDYKFQTKEEVMLFDHYRSFGYHKFVEGRERLLVKDTLYTL